MSTKSQLVSLRRLSGLDYTEQRLVSQLIFRGVRTEGDRACVRAMVSRHLSTKRHRANGARELT